MSYRTRRFAAVLIIALVSMPLFRLQPTARPALAAPGAAPEAYRIFQERFTTQNNLSALTSAVWDTSVHRLSIDLLNGVNRGLTAAAACPDGSIVVVGHYTIDDAEEVFAQRLNNRGFRMWPADVRVSAIRSPDAQTSPAVVVNANCQSIIVWQQTGLETRIFAQKLDANGVRLWQDDLQVNGLQARFPAVALAGADRIVIGYLKNDNTLAARQINWSGTFTWAEEKVIAPGCHGCRHVSLAPDGAGAVVAAWSQYDDRYDERILLAQKLDSTGTALWTVNIDQPIFAVNEAADERFGSLALAAGANGASLVWMKTIRDSLNNTAAVQVIARRLNSDGEPQWADSLMLAQFDTSGSADAYQERQTAVVQTAADEAIAAWTDESKANRQVSAQKISAAGLKLWSQDRRPSALAATASGEQGSPVLAPANGGSIFAAWSDARHGPPEPFAQVLTSAGERLWAADQRVFAADGNVPQSLPALAAGSGGNTMLAFADHRTGVSAVYLQKISSAGAAVWENGLRVSASVAAQTSPSLAFNAQDAASVVAWVDARNGSADIYAQKLDEWEKFWGADVRINDPARLPEERLAPSMVIGSDGSIYVAWQEKDSGQAALYLQKLNGSGARLWASDVLIDSFPITADGPLHFDLAIDPAGQAVYMIWDTSFNLLAQKVDTSGAPVWAAPVVVYDTLIYDAALAIDTGNQAIVVWTPALTTPDSTYNVYAQKLDAAGVPLWDAGLQISDMPGPSFPIHVDLAINPGGNAVVSWDDHSYGVDGVIRAQAFDAAGTRQWAQDVRVDASPAGAPAWGCALSLNTSGEAVVAWLDHRNGFGDLYAQKLSAAGVRRWTSDIRLIPDEGFYFASGQSISSAVDNLSAPITAARLNATLLANGGAAQFYLSNNGGANWYPVSLNRAFRFPTAGSDLRWRVALSASADGLASPQVTQVDIAYSDAGPLPAIFLPMIRR